MAKQLKALTLNCWGIPVPVIGSRDRSVRLKALADHLASSDLDIVCLQEIWCYADYQMIKEKLAAVLPESYYFRSGVCGSGVCLFSRGEIKVAMMVPFSLNGYPHFLHHADWFGGKGCGFARVELNGLKIDVYCTHLHAEYDRINDSYLSHRILQAFELSQLVNETARGDLTLVLGDLNLEPDDLGLKLIKSNACLLDAFIERKDVSQQDDDNEDGNTYDVPANYYSKPGATAKRIDYVLYRGGGDKDIGCNTCFTALGQIPNSDVYFSDHLAVCATFSIKATVDSDHSAVCATSTSTVENDSVHLAVCATLSIMADDSDSDNMQRLGGRQRLKKLLDQAILEMDKGIGSATLKQQMCGLTLIGLLVATLLLSICIEIGVQMPSYTVLMIIACLALLIGFYIVHGTIILENEKTSLRGARDGMLLVLTEASEPGKRLMWR